MDTIARPKKPWPLKPWQTVLLFGLFVCVLYGLGSFTFDLFAGGDTPPPASLGEVRGVGLYFIYVEGFFLALVVILPIRLLKRFGVGAMVYLPYAVLGLGVEFYMETVFTPALVGPLAVVGWCAIGLLIGLSADLAHRFLPSRLSSELRGAVTGLVLGSATFLLVLVALSFFYISPQTGSGSFLGQAWYGLPWLLVNSAFGGYVATLLAERFAPAPSRGG